jgi:transposase-like protein
MTKIDENIHEKVLMPCKRGTTQMTHGQSCDSKSAFKLTESNGPRASAPAFKCAKCGFEWTVPIGGTFTAC